MRELLHPWRALLGAIVLVIVPGLPASAVAPRPVTITIAGMVFTPSQVNVKVGDTIEWINKDVVDHTATAKKDALWNASIAPGKSARVVMKAAGTFDYFCRYHPNMVGRIVVGAKQTRATKSATSADRAAR